MPREQWQVPEAVSEHWEGVSEVKRKACAQAAVTDKVTAGHALGGHAYNLMYGMFLHPLRHKSLKMLEIGLGCGMTYGAGASAHLWRTLLPEAELWEAEIAEKCVEQHRRKLEQQGIHPLIGSARDPATLQHWMNISGGRFDVIIDDGGHTNLDITTAFDHLWGHLQPGGLYFVEDLQVGRREFRTYRKGTRRQFEVGSEDTNGERVFADLVASWIEQKLVPYPPLRLNMGDSPDGTGATDFGSWADTPSNARSIAIRKQHPMPPGLQFVFCQAEACVLGKEPSDAMRESLHVPCKKAQDGGRRR